MNFLEQDYQHAADLVGKRWKKLDGANIFFTGGTGFFGAWMLNTFLTAQKIYNFQCHISILSRNPDKFLRQFPTLRNEKNLSFIQGDIRDFSFPQENFSHVIHGAVDVAPSLTGQTIETFDVLYKGTERIIHFCQEKKISSLLFVSSGAVYGKQAAFVEEKSPLTHQPVIPNSLYAEGKRLSEWMLLNSSLSAQIKIARCFSFAGPHLSLQAPLAISYFLSQALKAQDIQLDSDGSALRSYMYGSDLATWLWTLLLEDCQEKVFNVGSSDSISVLALAKKIIAISEKNISVHTKSISNSSSYFPNVEKAEKELNLKITIPLDSAIEKSWRFWKENTP